MSPAASSSKSPPNSPGSTVDQSEQELGIRLMLPPWLEPDRARLYGLLPPLRLPQMHVHGR